MPTVAEQLRAAREARGLSINEVADFTKIRTDHIRALESGDYNVFSAPVYIKGFVRSYARLLKLEEPAIMGELDQELSRTEKFKEPPPLTNEPRGALDYVMLALSRVNWGLVLPILGGLLLLVAAALSFQAWRNHKNADPLANLGPGLYVPKPDLKDLHLPIPTNHPSAPRRN